MKVIIRADASVLIGSGHVMRCLTIAHKLQAAGCHVRFWMQPLEGNLIEFVAQAGFENISRAEQADLYIVDHYGLGIEWEQSIRPFTKKLVVIDDLARAHDCDLLLDQNVVPGYLTRYDGLVPAHCIKLLGPKYLMIRDEFIEARQQLTKHNVEVKRLLVFMGGTDPTHETMKVLKALECFSFEHVDVVVGSSNPLKNQIKDICLKNEYYFHCQIDYMARLMQQADFAIGAGGATMWERCYVGLPSSSTIVASNQQRTTEYAVELGLTINLGWHEHVNEENYCQLLEKLADGKLIRSLQKNGISKIVFSENNNWMKIFQEDIN